MVSALLYNFKMPRFSFKKRAGYSWLSLILIFQISPMDSAVGVEKNIRIAFQGPLSGPEAVVGNEEYDGVKYAVQQFNKRFNGKFNVSITLIDDQGDPAVAQKIAPTFAAIPSILGIVGPSYSGAAIASMPFYKAQNLAMISPSATRTSMTDPAQGAIGFPVFHRIPSRLEVEGPSLYKIATEGVSAPKVIIVDDQSSYGVPLSQSIKSVASPQNILATVSVGTNTSGVIDWSSTVNTVKSSGANVIIYTGYYPQAATLYTQLRNSGYKGILAGGEGVNSSSIFDFATSSVLEGVRLTAGTAPLSQINSELESNFRLFAGKPSGVYAAESIDATNVLLYCIATGVTTRTQMLTCIDGFRGTSVYGYRYGFDSYGDNIKQMYYGFEIKSGSIKLTQSFGRAKQTFLEIITSFPWYNVSPVAEGVNVTLAQVGSYTDRGNALVDGLNVHIELLDALNSATQDALDAESFSLLPSLTAQLSTLDSKLLMHSQNLDELNSIEDSVCSIINSDTSNSVESQNLQDSCAEFKDTVAAASDAFYAAEFSTDDVRGWLSYLQAEKAAADLNVKQDADAKAAAALKAKQEADAKAAADLKAKQEADAKAAADLKAKQEADAKAAAALKAKQEADAKAAADLKAKQEADAKAAADLRAKLEADSKAAAELRAKLEADIKAAADLRAKQEADTKAAAEKAAADQRAKQEADTKAAAEKAAADLRAKQEADTKAAAAKAAADKAAAAKAAAAKAAAAKAKKSPKVTCKKGSIVKVFVGKQCPPGYKK